MKKNILFIIIILVLFAIATSYFFISRKKTDNVFTRTDLFMWGVGANPSSLGRYHISTWGIQLNLIEKLNVGWVRLTWDSNNNKNDEIIKATWEHGLEVFLVVGPKDFTKLTLENAKNDGYNTLKQIARQYKGEIRYYQLFDEMNQLVLKNENQNNIDLEKYSKLKNWILGAEKAVAEYDSKARIVIPSKYNDFLFLTKLKNDGIKFDVVDWQISSSEFSLINQDEIGERKTFNKPVILTIRSNQTENEEIQSDFINQIVQVPINNKPLFSGVFVRDLLDSRDISKDYSGIVKIKKTPSGSYIPSDIKKAYDVYKNLIKGSNENWN